MNRRGFLKMLGLAVPAAVVAPLLAETVPPVSVGHGSYGLPMSGGRIDLMQKWQRLQFDKPLYFEKMRMPEGY